MAEHKHDEHYHPPGLQHQFEDMDQQLDSVTIGMWGFLVQEVMFFGGLFTAYLVFRWKYPIAFATGSNLLDAFWGFANTLVLIVSSLTMALAVYFTQKGNRSMQLLMIILTMIFGTVFLCVKGVEYYDKYVHGHVPVAGWNKIVKVSDNEAHANSNIRLPFEVRAEAAGAETEVHANPQGNFQLRDSDLELVNRFTYQQLTPSEQAGYFNGESTSVNKQLFTEKVAMFFWIYFVMTGLHALHMIIGLGIMLWLLYKAFKSTFSADYYSPVEVSGLYWHFVDIVWIFLFPLLYLLGRHYLAGGGH
ncbi:MAG: cytochrome c oxidase subunit 3 [Pyrinomonadaceae bacterium]